MVHTLQRFFDAGEIVGEHAFIARPFLTECERRSILHVRPANLDDVLPLVDFRGDCIAQRLHRRDKPLLHVDGRRDIHCGWKRVV